MKKAIYCTSFVFNRNKIVFLNFLLLLFARIVLAQQIITTAPSPLQITSTVNALTAMAGSSSYTLAIKNTGTSGPASATFQISFPSEFKVVFPTALPSEIQISGNNPYTVEINDLADHNTTVSFNYDVESCFLPDFGNDLQKTRDIIFYSSDPNILINSPGTQTINISRGQSVTVLDPVPADRHEVFMHEGGSFTRIYHISSNGSNGTAFTGIIEFSDVLGNALVLAGTTGIELQYVLPGGTPQNLAYSVSAGTVSATINVGNLLPPPIDGLQVGQEIQIIERIRIANCLDAGAGNSTVTISWRKATSGACVSTARVLTPAVTRPSAPLTYLVSYPNDEITPSALCYSSTTSNNGTYTTTKRYENNLPGNNLDNVRFQLFFSWYDNSFISKRPLEGIRLVRTNALNPSRNMTIVDFGDQLASNPPANFAAVSALIAQFSSYNSSDNNSYYYWANDMNVFDYYPNGGDGCSDSHFQVYRLFIDRYPDGNGGFVKLNFEEGDVYDFSWEEVQCCRTDAEAKLHDGKTSRWGRAGLALEYPLCNAIRAVNEHYGPHGYFNILETTQKFLANTTKVLGPNSDRNAATRDGEIADVHIETLVSSAYGMGNYPLLDGTDPVFLDLDILLTEGLSLDIRGDVPLPAIHEAFIRYKSGAGLIWNPTSIIDHTADLITTPRYVTHDDNINLPMNASKEVAEYQTLRFNMNDLADLLNLQGAGRNVERIISELRQSEIFIRVKSISCPPGDSAVMAVRSYLVNRPACTTCRNLMTSTSFTFTLHCPGCVIPGPAINASTSLRDPASMGPMDNDNDGVADVIQNPANDHRNRSVVRLGDLMTSTVTAGFPNGDDDKGGYTYASMLSARPEYIQDNGYLRTVFSVGHFTNGNDKGGLELRRVIARLRGNSVTLLDLTLSTPVFPGPDRIKMQNNVSVNDYASASPVGGFMTAHYNTFYFRVELSDFDASDLDGFNYGSDDITFEITYQIVKDIEVTDNIVPVAYLLYTAKDPGIYVGATPNIADAANYSDPADLPPTGSTGLDNAFFWCTAGESIFGYVKYNAIHSHYLQDPYVETYNYGIPALANSCSKIMHVKTEAWPVNAINGVKYDAFENEYRTVNHPTQYQVQIPQGYTITGIELLNSNGRLIDYNSSRGHNQDVYESTMIPVPAVLGAGNTLTVSMPSYVPATVANGDFTNVTQFQQMDEVSFSELRVFLNANCDDPSVPDIIYWTPPATTIPSGAIRLDFPVITTPSLPTLQYFLPNGGTQAVTTAGDRYPRQYVNFYFIKPKTDVQLTNNGSTNIAISESVFDYGVRVKNTPPKDPGGVLIPNPYNASYSIPSVNANHTYISFNATSLPVGFILDFIYESESAISPLPTTNRIFPLSPSTAELVFDVGTVNANSERNFRIVGHYDCSISGCNPMSETLANCMINSAVTLNYGWNCNAPVPGNTSSCDVNTPLAYTFSNSPVRVNLTVPTSQAVEYCNTYTHPVQLESLENGSISKYVITITLPDNAEYIPNSTTLDGVAFSEPTINSAGTELIYTVQNLADIRGLASNINHHNTYLLNFNYKLNCVALGSETSGMEDLTTNVESFTYCSSTDTRQSVTTINNSGVQASHYDQVDIEAMQCTSGAITQGVFESHIQVKNTSTTLATNNENRLVVTLPAGTSLNLSGTTPDYTQPTSNTVEWIISDAGNSIPANTSLSDYVVSFSVTTALTSCQQDFVLNAKVIGQPDITCSASGICNIPKELSVEACTSSISKSTYVGVNTVSGDASFLCDGNPVVFAATPSGMDAPYIYEWYIESPIGSGTYVSQATHSNITGSDNYSISLAGNYKVIVTDDDGCTAANYASAIDHLEIECPADICPGESPNIKVLNAGNVVGSYKAQWYDPNGSDTNAPSDLAADILMDHGILVSGYYYAAAITPSCTLRTNERTPQKCPITVKRAPNAYHITTDKPSGDAPVVFLCDGQQVTFSVTNKTVNTIYPTDVIWRSGQTTLDDVVGPGSWTNSGSLLTAQELEKGSYFVVAIDQETQCRTISNEIWIETPRIVIRRTCESGNQIRLTAISNFNVAPTDYDWQLDGTPLAQGTASIIATQAGVYSVVEHSTGCTLSNRCWGIKENLNTTAIPNEEQLSIQDGGFEGITDCSVPLGFNTDFDCIDRTGYTGGTLPADYTIGKFMINQPGLQASDWSPNSPSTWVNNNTTFVGDGALFIDGESAPQAKLIWGKTVPVTHGYNYLYRFKVRNINILTQYPVEEIPELYVQITYIDDQGNGTRYKTNKQALFNNGVTPWIEFSSYTPALPYTIPGCLTPTEIVEVKLELFMDGGGSIGRDLSLDDVSLIPIGVCDDVIQLNLPCNTALAELDNSHLVICPGSTAQFNVQNAPTGLTFLWQEKVNGLLTTVGANASFTTPTLNLTDPDKPEFFQYQVTVTDPVNHCSTQLSATAIVSPNPKLSITSELTGNNCEKIFTATFDGLGTPAQYDWYVNSTLVTGNTGSTYTVSNLQNGDNVQCKVANVWCATGGEISSNVISNSAVTVTADAGPDKSICHADPVSIGTSAQSGVSYSWSPALYLDDPTLSNPSVSMSGTTNETSLTYTLTATDIASGCIGGTDEVTITINPLPGLATLSALTEEVCMGNTGSFTLERESGHSYQYNTVLDNGTIPSGTGSYTINNLNVGNGSAIFVEITVTNDLTSCVRSSSHVITVLPKPVISSFSPTIYICKGGTYPFQVADHTGSVYNWTVNNGASVSSGQTTSNVSITFPNSVATIDIEVVETKDGCSSDPYTYQAAAFEPVITAGDDVTLCQGQSTTLNATPGLSWMGGYNWSSVPTSGMSEMSTPNGPSAPVVTPSVTTTYTLTSSVYGCPATASVTVTVKPMPSAPTVTEGERCGTGTVTLGATVSNGTIKWYAASTGGSPVTGGTPDPAEGTSFTTPIISATTTYYTETELNGCTSGSRTAVTATVKAMPANQLFVSSLEYCNTATGGMGYANTPGTVRFVLPSGVNAAGGFSPAQGVSVQLINFSTVTTTTVYTIEAQTILDGCTTSVNIPTTINPIPTAPTVTDANNTYNCTTNTYSLTATHSSGNTTIFRWYDNPAGSLLSTGATYSPTISAKTSYLVQYEDPTTHCVSGYTTVYLQNKCKGLRFNHSSFQEDIVKIPATTLMDHASTDPFTYEIFFTPANAASTSKKALISNRNDPDGLTIGILSGRPYIKANNLTSLNVTSGNTIANDVCHHLVVTRDAAGTVKIYLNGTQYTQTFTLTAALAANQPTRFGKDLAATTEDYHQYKGMIDEVRIWNKVLTTTEMQNYANKNVMAISGLRAVWMMLEGSGQLVAAANNSAYDGTLGGTNTSETNDPTWEAYNVCTSYQRLSMDESEPESEVIETFNIYANPNPFTDQTLVTVTGTELEYVRVLLIDVNGKTVYENDHFPVNESTSVGDKLSAGMYLLKVIDGEKIHSEKLLKFR